jgi:hypothetical protein
MQNAMGVPGNRRGRIGDQQAAGHAQMHDPLQARCSRRTIREVEYDVFADPVNAVDQPALELGRHELGRRIEGF